MTLRNPKWYLQTSDLTPTCPNVSFSEFKFIVMQFDISQAGQRHFPLGLLHPIQLRQRLCNALSKEPQS